MVGRPARGKTPRAQGSPASEIADGHSQVWYTKPMNAPANPVVTNGVDGTTLSIIVQSYPGPALHLAADRRIAAANAAAAEMVEHDGRWLPSVADWVESGRVTPGLHSVPVSMPRGVTIVEWAAVPLPGGDALLFGRDCTLERQLRHTLTESRQRYKDLVEVSSDFAWETGPDGRFAFVSPRGALGYAAESLVGRDPRDLAVEEWGDLPLPFDTRRAIDQSELWLRTAEGSPACVVASALPLFGQNGAWAGARGVCREVTDQVMRSAELGRIRNRERLLAHIVHMLRDQLDAVHALDVAAAETARALGADGCRIYRAIDGGVLAIVAAFESDDDAALAPESMRPVLEAIVDGEGPVTADIPPQPGRHGGARVLGARTDHRKSINGAVIVWRGADGDPWDGDDRHLIAGMADHLGIAHAQMAYQERLRRLSERDGLTGLFNRVTFFERLEEALERPERGASALLYVDLDNFKAVNDLHGHLQGDEVLKGIGNLLTTGVRPGDLPGRLGGDEFVLWLGRADEEKAAVVAQRLLAGMRHLQHLSASPEKPLGMSIGIAVHRAGQSETVQEFIDRADAAMYQAKGSGKGRFAIAPARVMPEETSP